MRRWFGYPCRALADRNKTFGPFRSLPSFHERLPEDVRAHNVAVMYRRRSSAPVRSIFLWMRISIMRVG